MAKRSLFSHSFTIEEPMINLTPLIDVVFVILIMFIVIAPLLEMDQVELADGPTAASITPSVQEASLVTIYVHQDNTIWLNKQKLSSSELVNQLKQAKQQFPNARPQIFHDKSAHFGTYQSVKNAAEEAGFSHLDVILKPA